MKDAKWISIPCIQIEQPIGSLPDFPDPLFQLEEHRCAAGGQPAQVEDDDLLAVFFTAPVGFIDRDGDCMSRFGRWYDAFRSRKLNS